MKLLCDSSPKWLSIIIVPHGGPAIGKLITLLAPHRAGACSLYFYLDSELSPSPVVV